ncbi:DNA polymerase IV [Patescibacteria group bacterium]|nr:DNA polymerase IV [Patescibacteria group bacterium]
MSLYLHVDMDSFFASVEQQANPTLRGKPVGVTGGTGPRAVVVAASIEAKKQGVKTPTILAKAKLICPDFVPIWGDFEKYIFIHHQILKIFEKYTATVSVFSIDEAFLEVSRTARRFGGAQKIAELIKREFRGKLGERITCSIGIAPSRALSKLASKINKPDGVFVINQRNQKEILKTTAVESLCGVGFKTKKKLNQLGIVTAQDLGCYSLRGLIRRFGVNGYFLHALGRGEDLKGQEEENKIDCEKSFGHQYTFPENLDYQSSKDRAELKAKLFELCEGAARRMRRKNLACRTISLRIRFYNFSSFSRDKSFKCCFFSTEDVYQKASVLLDEAAPSFPLRLIGISLSTLTRECSQKSLFLKEQQKKNLSEALDDINSRWGELTVKTGHSLLSDGRGVFRESAFQRKFRA